MTSMVGLRLFKLSFIVIIVVLFYVYALRAVEFDPFDIIQSMPRFFWLLSQMWPPDFTYFLNNDLIEPLIKTVQMAILGTFLGALCAIPLILFGTQIVTRRALIFWPARTLMNIIRTIPDFLYAIIFVATLGIGPLAGVAALTFFACAIISKLTSESVDNINRKPIEAIQATGASKIQIIRYGILPQILPAFIDHTIYVFELSIRVSTVIGWVGAGGIGTALNSTLENFWYARAAPIILAIFGLVVMIDFIGNRVRDAFLHGTKIPLFAKVSLALGFVYLMWWPFKLEWPFFTSWLPFSAIEIDIQRITQGMVYLKNLLLAMIPDMSKLFSLGTAEDPTKIQFFFLSIDKEYGGFLWYCFVQMLQSISIALVGTTISFILSFPLGLFASRKYTGVPPRLALTMKQIPNAIRSFPEFVLAIFLMASFGPGPLPGALAIAIHSIGMIGKFNAEIVEKIRKEQVEALQATGANRAQVFLFGILPQVMPEFFALAIYRFEINVRAASVLGIVGAGGIGKILNDVIAERAWDKVGMCLLIIIICVMVIDFISARIRRRLIEGATTS
jgi:phosphonate transport system permease protein